MWLLNKYHQDHRRYSYWMGSGSVFSASSPLLILILIINNDLKAEWVHQHQHFIIPLLLCSIILVFAEWMVILLQISMYTVRKNDANSFYIPSWLKEKQCNSSKSLMRLNFARLSKKLQVLICFASLRHHWSYTSPPSPRKASSRWISY